MKKKNIAVILAAGTGERSGFDMPKQLMKLAGKPIVEHTISNFQNSAFIDEINIVTSDNCISKIEDIVTNRAFTKVKKIICGGQERYESSLAAINASEQDSENFNIKLIFHDAVRPLVNDRIIRDVVQALDHYNAVDVVVPTTDTMISADPITNTIDSVPERKKLRNGQTPQGFSWKTIKLAYDLALRDPNFKTTDDCGVVFKYLPDEREKGETRIKQCHLVMLRMFKILDYLCTKHDIKYFLCSGTLKGAIRNKGFKPWDDDFDVGMTRDNYEKFVLYAVPELSDDIFFQTPETDIYFPSCGRVEAKLRDKFSSYNRMENQKDSQHHSGIMLDILVFDRAYLPHNFFIFLLNRSLKFLFQHKGNKERATVLKWISKYSPFPLVYSNSFIDGRKMIRMGANYFREKEISTLIKTKFEDTEAFIPCGWHGYLKRKYGNYMELPSIEKQKGHHSIDVPDPFTPCHHAEILYWKDTKMFNNAAKLVNNIKSS